LGLRKGKFASIAKTDLSLREGRVGGQENWRFLKRPTCPRRELREKVATRGLAPF